MLIHELLCAATPLESSLVTVGTEAGEVLQFGEMIERGIVPLVGTFHALVSVECAHGSLNDAVGVVDLMEDAGITSLGRTCTTLLDGAEKQGRSDISAVVSLSCHFL